MLELMDARDTISRYEVARVLNHQDIDRCGITCGGHMSGLEST